ncbi:hypothetical protein TNCV_1993211 [Trichonephila clavipes]|nr:hypothetical protein TNCV_1993211 [Trichonephila clavipes]
MRKENKLNMFRSRIDTNGRSSGNGFDSKFNNRELCGTSAFKSNSCIAPSPRVAQRQRTGSDVSIALGITNCGNYSNNASVQLWRPLLKICKIPNDRDFCNWNYAFVPQNSTAREKGGGESLQVDFVPCTAPCEV